MRNYLLKNEIVKLFNTTKETLRHYENIGLINPEKNDMGYRKYSNDDIQKLREIFFLRDVGLSLDKIKRILQTQLDNYDIVELLNADYQKLLVELNRVKKTADKVFELMNFIDQYEETIGIFQIKRFDERFFLMMKHKNEKEVLNPKIFYDRFKEIIVSENYSEKSFSMIYSYDRFTKKKGIYSTQCIEIYRDEFQDNEIRALPAGNYLCLLYKFNFEQWDGIEQIKENIDNFMEENRLKFALDIVIELERHEYGMICGENEAIYEIQIPIIKEEGEIR